MAEITVSSFSDFKNALESAEYDVIHLGGDIVFASGGAVIPRNKTNVLIDGHGYTITDYNSLAIADTVRYQNLSGSPATITIQNVTWSGRNFYGVVYTSPNSNFSDFNLVLDNVKYTGPQAVYNRTGTTYFVDSEFNIERNGSGSAGEELGELHHAVVRGNVTVNSQATGNSVMWFLNESGSLTVEENAVFKVDAPDTYMFYTDGTPPPSMQFQENSVTEISTRYGLFYAVSATAYLASSFALEAGASFTSTQSGRRAVPTFKCRDSFRVEPGSSLFISAEAAGTSPLLYFPVRATLSFNDPKSVVLYNNGGRVFDFDAGSGASPNTINIDTELLNMWTAAGSGDFDDLPTRALAKEDGSNISAVINTSTTAVTAVSSNIADGDKGYPMTPATFNVMQAQVVSMGRLSIDLDTVRDISTAITGNTEASANLRASYDSQQLSGSADAAGGINLPVPQPIAVGTEITFGSNWKFLTKYITVISEGSVTITHLEDLVFVTSLIPCRKRMIKRTAPGWYIEVTDTREGGADWLLYARIDSPLSYDVYTLDDALLLDSEIMENAVPVLVRRESWTGQGVVTRITWQEIDGFWLRLDSDFMYHAGRYVTEMYWEVIVDE